MALTKAEVADNLKSVEWELGVGTRAGRSTVKHKAEVKKSRR
jgi:hypothetical protein